MADVLVIIVTYNALKWVSKCLRSVENSTHPADVVVIDNGSTDGTLPLIRTDFPQVRIVETGENLGFGAANNIGLRMALDEGYAFAYLLNQDAWLEKDTLEKLVAAHKPEWGVLSPMQLNAGGKRDKRFNKKCGKYINSAMGGFCFAFAQVADIDSERLEKGALRDVRAGLDGHLARKVRHHALLEPLPVELHVRVRPAGRERRARPRRPPPALREEDAAQVRRRRGQGLRPQSQLALDAHPRGAGARRDGNQEHLRHPLALHQGIQRPAPGAEGAPRRLDGARCFFVKITDC